MDILVKIAITAPDGAVHEHEIAAFEKGCESAAEIGLSIGDSKALAASKGLMSADFQTSRK